MVVDLGIGIEATREDDLPEAVLVELLKVVHQQNHFT
jgi:hypothetical protein